MKTVASFIFLLVSMCAQANNSFARSKFEFVDEATEVYRAASDNVNHDRPMTNDVGTHIVRLDIDINIVDKKIDCEIAVNALDKILL